MDDQKESRTVHEMTLESLKLIVQSQMILSDLVHNQARLYDLIAELQEGTTSEPE